MLSKLPKKLPSLKVFLKAQKQPIHLAPQRKFIGSLPCPLNFFAGRKGKYDKEIATSVRLLRLLLLLQTATISAQGNYEPGSFVQIFIQPPLLKNQNSKCKVKN